MRRYAFPVWYSVRSQSVNVLSLRFVCSRYLQVDIITLSIRLQLSHIRTHGEEQMHTDCVLLKIWVETPGCRLLGTVRLCIGDEAVLCQTSRAEGGGGAGGRIEIIIENVGTTPFTYYEPHSLSGSAVWTKNERTRAMKPNARAVTSQ